MAHGTPGVSSPKKVQVPDMSSTNRGGVREANDYYVTPIEQIKLFLNAWAADDWHEGFPFVSAMDPCAGGTIGREGMSYPLAMESLPHLFRYLGIVHTIDIREDSCAASRGDYLTQSEHPGQYDIIITNPPFSIAQQVANKAFRDVKAGGFIVMLLRLNYLGSQERLSFWNRNPPYRIYVHSTRMKFNSHRTDIPKRDRNKTDSIEYAHFIWWTRHNRGPALLSVI